MVLSVVGLCHAEYTREIYRDVRRDTPLSTHTHTQQEFDRGFPGPAPGQTPHTRTPLSLHVSFTHIKYKTVPIATGLGRRGKSMAIAGLLREEAGICLMKCSHQTAFQIGLSSPFLSLNVFTVG